VAPRLGVGTGTRQTGADRRQDHRRGSGSKSLSYYLYAGNSEFKPYGEVQHVLGTGKKATATTAPPGATWSHIALTYDGAVERLYVNGAKVAETATEAPVTTSGELQIGAETEHGEWFSGRVDEVRIYDRALNAGEVGPDMEAPIQTPRHGPVAAWSFDEGEGSTAEDITGDDHTATIEGATWARGRFGGSLKFGAGNPCVSVPDSPSRRLGIIVIGEDPGISSGSNSDSPSHAGPRTREHRWCASSTPGFRLFLSAVVS